jgi:hypothetical protein
MAKAASSPTTKRTTTTKSQTTPAKSRAQAPKAVTSLPPVSGEEAVTDLTAVTDRLTALEENLTQRLSSLATEIIAEKATLSRPGAGEQDAGEILLPLIADLMRRSLTEQLTPIVASLKRIEERVGFIGNRLKHPATGQEQRQKPWRHDQQPRHNRPPRGANGPRPSQGQQWTPPSAASVQGHFAPRPLHGGVAGHATEEDDQ